MKAVLQPWVLKLTFMQQSVLISAVRAPDGIPKNHIVKKLMRWYRRCILHCAFHKVIHYLPSEKCGGSFTGVVEDIEYTLGEYLKRVDEIPHHFHLHLMHASEILGYKHPTKTIRLWWYKSYRRMVNDMHLSVETEEDMDKRLGDNEAAWREKEEVVAD